MEVKRSFTHSTCNYKYHIVFAPKDRVKMFYGEKRVEVGMMLREIRKGKMKPYQIYLLLSTPLKYSVPQIMEYLIGKNAMMLFE